MTAQHVVADTLGDEQNHHCYDAGSDPPAATRLLVILTIRRIDA